MTSVLVSSIIATPFATAVFVVVVVVDPSHAHARYSTTSSPSPSSATFAPDGNGTATTTTAATTTAQVVKTFDEIYNDTICNNQRSCHLVGNVSSADKTLARRNCMCDVQCNVYGDCCFDSPFYDERDQKTNFKLFHCPAEKWYLKASCSTGFADREIVRRCADGVEAASNDVRVITPVTDLERNVTYANVYCAMCDGRDPRLPGLRPWNVTFRCEVNATGRWGSEAGAGAGAGAGADGRDRDDAEVSAVAHNLRWDESLREYRADYGGRAYKCQPLRQPAAGSSAGLRRCAAVVSGCPAAADAELAANCESFALFVHDEPLSYRNVFCAQCNNVTAPLSGCKPGAGIDNRFSTSQRIFSGANKATGNAACSDPNVNPDLKKRFCPP